MIPPRIIVPPDMDGLYHVVCRVVDRRMIFGEEEKRRFRELLVAYAGFSGIEVVAWCLMDKHFHLLLHVPSKQWVDPASLPEKEVLRRLAGKSEGMSGSTTTWGDTSDRIEGSLQANGGDGVAMRFGHWGGLRVLRDLRVGLGAFG